MLASRVVAIPFLDFPQDCIEISGNALLLQLKLAPLCARRRIRGGIAGAYPIWGGYERLGYPNWAAKFFADALMLQESVMRGLGDGQT